MFKRGALLRKPLPGGMKAFVVQAGPLKRMNFVFTPAETGPLRKTPWIRSFGKQVIDLTELRGSWNVAYVYNKESLRKASQHHRKGLLLGRAICRCIAI